MVKNILKVALLALILIQFFKIDKTNPPINPAHDLLSAEVIDQEVLTILEDACNDCHSYQTTYPWYTNIEPLSWYVKGHIKHGRGNLNFSEWYNYSEAKQKHKAEECVERINNGSMPLSSYKIMHPKSRLDDAQKLILINFFNDLSL